MILYRTPGRSFTRPPRTSTIECSCRLWPTPGMYAVTSTWDVSFTRATLRSAEFGFLGVVVYTRVHTPRRCGQDISAGALVLTLSGRRPIRISWLMVGMVLFHPLLLGGGEGELLHLRAPYGQSRPGGDQVADDDVLLEAAQVVDLGGGGGLGQHAR